MSAEKNPLSRWVHPNPRYDKKTLDYILSRYREQHGWHQGARVAFVQRS